MPSNLHQTLIRLFEDRPSMLSALLGDALSLPFERLVPLPNDVTEHSPSQLLADLVLACPNRRAPEAIVVLEVQLGRDERKRLSWPHYLTGLRRRFGCPVVLIVICDDDDIAKWAGEPIALGPGSWVTPIALGPAQVPVDDGATGQEIAPELRVLRALAHRASPAAPALALAALDALTTVDDERATIFVDTLLSSLPEATRRALEELMSTGNYEYQSDFAKKYIQRGLEQGLARGLEQGLEQGVLRARVAALLTVLEARQLPVSAVLRRHVESTQDAELVDEWIRAAATASSLDEIFGAALG